jgi:hypothetical protein
LYDIYYSTGDEKLLGPIAELSIQRDTLIVKLFPEEE